MKFKFNGKKVVLRGTRQSELQWMQGRQLPKMVVKDIKDGRLEEMEVSHFGKKWFEQDIDGENEDDSENKLLMVNEEGWMS
nr:hypothetical protein [Tanacetum cinerariifolium]